MKNKYPEIIEKSLFYIEKTRERLGWLVVNVYRFPAVDGFGCFLEAVQKALVRHGLFSWYLWTRDCARDQYLLVHIGRGQWAGHFERECSVIIPRLWQRYSPMPYAISDTDLFRNLSAEGGFTTPVDRYPNGKSPYGCFDMAGNSWDWTSSEITATNGAERGKTVNAIRGGSWCANKNSCRTSYRGEGRRAQGRYNTVGFRLVAEKKNFFH